MIKTGKELAAAALAAANRKTLYVSGCFGAPMTAENKQRYIGSYSFNRREERAAKINAASADTFGFDCVCFLKALLWGWMGDAGQQYGGAKYQSDGVPDIDEGSMLEACSDISADFSNIQVGEYLWMEGHCGIYIGEGKAVECTYRWADGVQVTEVYNIRSTGGNGRSWTKHGKLPYVSYEQEAPVPAPSTDKTFSVTLRQLKKGHKGADVKALQQLLVANGHSCGGCGADGDFGAATEQAVVAYQRAKGLEADGIAGAKTWGALLGV